MQLKHLPICFVAVAALCLAGAVGTFASPTKAEVAPVSAKR